MIGKWKFRVYRSGADSRPVQKEIDRLTTPGRERLFAQIRYLASLDKMGWSYPQSRKLVGYSELYEIRFLDQRRQMRAIGFFGPTSGVFTVTVLAYHKDNVYKPADAFQTADKRRKEVCEGRASSDPLEIDGEDVSTLFA